MIPDRHGHTTGPIGLQSGELFLSQGNLLHFVEKFPGLYPHGEWLPGDVITTHHPATTVLALFDRADDESCGFYLNE